MAIWVKKDQARFIARHDVAQGCEGPEVGQELILCDRHLWEVADTTPPSDCVGGETILERGMSPVEQFWHVRSISGMPYTIQKRGSLKDPQEHVASLTKAGVYAVYDREHEEILVLLSQQNLDHFYEKM